MHKLSLSNEIIATNKLNSGQTLINFLFFTIFAITITSAAIIVTILNTKSLTDLQEGTLTYYIAGSGIENAIVRLLRNPDYTGETLTIDDGTASITVTGDNPKTIISEGRLGNFLRKIQVVVTYNNGIYNISSWEEL